MYRITIKNGETSTILHENKSKLAVAVSGGFSEEVNCIPSADIEIFRQNPCWDLLSDRKTIVEFKNTLSNEVEFEGTLLRSSCRMTNSGQVIKSLICEGFLGYLCDSIQPYHHYENTTAEGFLTAVLAVHNSMMPEEKRIYLGSCDVVGDNTNSKTTAYRNTLEEIKVNLIERLGCEIRVRRVNGNLVLDLLTHYGTKSNTVIELGKNIRSLEVSSDPTNIITRLIPLGAQIDASSSAERVDITSVNSGLNYIDDSNAIAKYGIIAGTVTFDNITIPANLKAAGQDYLANNNRLKKAYAGQVLDLSVLDSSEQSIKAGNTYRFKNSLLGIDEDLRLMKRKVNIYEPYSPEVEIGDKSERMTDIAVRTAQLIEYDMPEQKLDILASAKATATALLDAGINGYCVINKNEILIMDTPYKETATKIWRWNKGGFGYSNDGGDTYGIAITMDGAIVADFITAGKLVGLDINNGDGTFHVLPDGTVQASAIEITGGRINMTTSSANYDVISLSYQDLNTIMRSGEFRIKNSTSKHQIVIQSQGVWVYNDYDNSPTFTIGSSTGNIFTSGAITAAGNISTQGNVSGVNMTASGTMTADTVYFKLNNVNSNLSTVIGGINGRLDAIDLNINDIYDRISSMNSSISSLDSRVSALEGNT